MNDSLRPHANGTGKAIGAVLAGLATAGIIGMVVMWGQAQGTEQTIHDLRSRMVSRASKESVDRVESRAAEDRETLQRVAEDVATMRGDVKEIRSQLEQLSHRLRRYR